MKKNHLKQTWKRIMQNYTIIDEKCVFSQKNRHEKKSVRNWTK